MMTIEEAQKKQEQFYQFQLAVLDSMIEEDSSRGKPETRFEIPDCREQWVYDKLQDVMQERGFTTCQETKCRSGRRSLVVRWGPSPMWPAWVPAP